MKGVSIGYGRLLGETDKAIRVVLDDSLRQHWIPKSQVHDDSEVWDTMHDEGNIVVNAWFAEQLSD